MRQFVPIKKNKKTKKQKAICKIQKERIFEENTERRYKRNGVLITNKKK